MTDNLNLVPICQRVAAAQATEGPDLLLHAEIIYEDAPALVEEVLRLRNELADARHELDIQRRGNELLVLSAMTRDDAGVSR